MIIPIDEKFRIASDRYQWTIERRRSRKRNGRSEVEWRGESFHPTFESAAATLGERWVRESEANGIAAALCEIKNIASKLSEALPTEFRVVRESDTNAARLEDASTS